LINLFKAAFRSSFNFVEQSFFEQPFFIHNQNMLTLSLHTLIQGHKRWEHKNALIFGRFGGPLHIASTTNSQGHNQCMRRKEGKARRFSIDIHSTNGGPFIERRSEWAKIVGVFACEQVVGFSSLNTYFIHCSQLK
jgi:hypothetical protein